MTLSFRKIYLSLYWKAICEWDLETEQSCNILIPTLMAISVSCPFSLAAQPGTWGTAFLGGGFLYRILYPTDWISCALSYIIVQRRPSICRRHKLHSFNPSTVKVILCYSSTGGTCYLHRCISYFDSPAGSEDNIQQSSLTYQNFTCEIFLHVFLHHPHTHILQNNSPGQW